MEYYVDSQFGNDQFDGLQPSTAWKSLERVNAMVYRPGDKILLKRGCSWRGILSPSGDGQIDVPITVDAYGEGEEKPWIDGVGGPAAIYLLKVNYWTIQNIKCSNRAEQRYVRSGIMICGSRETVCGGIVIRNCEITDVRGENRRKMPAYRSMYWNSGIYVTQPGRCTEQAHLEDILVEGNHIYDVHTSGIRVNQEEDFVKDIEHRNIRVRGNLIERTGADAIIVANSMEPLIEFNRCFDAGALGTVEDTELIAAVWVCACRDALIQYNEVARTRLFKGDGTAFDTDWGVAGLTTIRYNYSHENQGGFWLDCTAVNHHPDCAGTLLYGNISVDDLTCIAQGDTGVKTNFENNVFIRSGQTAVKICENADGISHVYLKNTFAFLKEPSSGWHASTYTGNNYSEGMRNYKDPEAAETDHHWADLVDRLESLDRQENVFGLEFLTASIA